jgi:membrane associated rhomboid family serine protease
MIPFKDNLRYLAQPMVTNILILLNCLFFIVEEAMLHSGSQWAALVQNYGMFTPANFTHAFGDADPLAMFLVTCTLFTSMFLHGGLMHIFGNMLFLCCFGRAVEVRLGARRFVAFYLLAGLAAAFGQYLMNPLSEVRVLGASGAIAGVLSAYLIFWPKARVLGLSLTMGVLYAPAWSFLIWWIGGQVFSVVFESPGGGGGVAYGEHLGGFVCGIFAALIVRRLTPVHGVTYDQSTPSSKKHSRKLGAARFVWQRLRFAVSRLKSKKVQLQEGA